MLIISMLVLSFLVLIMTIYIWRETSSRSSALNGVFTSLALLISARVTAEGQQPDMAFGLPLLAGMLLLGRGVGTWLRSRKEPVLFRPAIMWLFSGAATLSCSWVVYAQFTS